MTRSAVRDERLSPAVRELACLALGHLDADRTRCVAATDNLVRDLIEQLNLARAGGPVVEGRRAEAVTALDDALTEASIAEVPDSELSEVVLAHLASQGWALGRATS